MALAEARAGASLPMWWVRAPQQPAPFATTTSTPWRVSRRIVASLISGARTCWAQPFISATRARRGPSAGKAWGRSQRLAVGIAAGVRASMAPRRPGKSFAKGRANQAPTRARRKRQGTGSSQAKSARSSRSRSGRR